MKHPLFLKVLALLGVGSLLFVFLLNIQGIIWERQSYRSQALASVSQSIAGTQTLLGPVVHMACVESWDTKVKDAEGNRLVENKREFMLTATPHNLSVQTNVQVEQRSRSLYQANVLNTKASLKAQFEPSDSLKAKASVADSRMQCGAPILMLSMDDPRGIRNASATLNGQDTKLKAGTFHPTYKRGMHLQLPLSFAHSSEPWGVEMTVEYVGTDRLGIVPLGETTTFRMDSNWPHPSFTGRFAPSQRQITDGQGFTAQWRLTSVATDAAQQVAQAKPICGHPEPQDKGCAESIVVDFVEPINFYSLSDRATKYAVLFVALTFAGLALFEVMKRLRVHPLQYLLAGAAICTFFLLLVSLSEHIGFMWAYASGASATVLLLTYYARYVLGNWMRSLPFGAGMALLYGMLYALLQLEQTALAVGSVGLFVVLAIVMILTRHVDWYAQLAQMSASSKPAPQSPHARQEAA